MSDTTIRDIAKQCGVSVSTVSRALNNHPDIRPDTKEMIMKVIKETGFVPNDSARYLKRSEANSIALLVKGITNPFFSTMIRVMEDMAHNRGFMTILRHVRDEEDEVTVAQALIKERRLKGIVFLGGKFVHDQNVLDQLDVPFIFSTIGNVVSVDENTGEIQEIGPEGRQGRHMIRYANIAVDDVEASCRAVEYLISLGHKKIGIITEGLDCPSVGQLRLRGYKKALEEHGLSCEERLIFEAREGIEHYSMPNGYNGARTLLQADPDMTAVFCISDVLAVGACRAITEMGRAIPADISVIGYDGIELGSYYNPRLTTIQQPVEQIAEKTIAMLFDMMENKAKPQNLIMPAELVIRDSTGPAPAGHPSSQD